MHFRAAWLSMSDGITGMMIASASRTSSGICCDVTAAGVSTTTRCVPGGTRIMKLRVTRRLVSKAAMPWIGGRSAVRCLSQRKLEPCGS